jgi:hypothetical protein
MERFFAGKISQTGNLSFDLLLTAYSLSQQTFTVKNTRTISNLNTHTRYLLLPKYVNRLSIYHDSPLVRRGLDTTFAHRAVEKGNLLFRAIEKKDERHLRELLEAGIHQHKKFFYTYLCPEFDYRFRMDYVPLYYAIHKRFVEGVKILMEYKTCYLEIEDSYYSERNHSKHFSKTFMTLTDFMWHQVGECNAKLINAMEKNLNMTKIKEEQKAIKDIAHSLGLN